MEIRLKHLTKIFPGNPKKNIPDTHAVEDLNLTIPDGKLYALLGPSGCGKSTTLNMIAGLSEPSSGEIWFGDEDVTDLSPEKRGIGLVFQNYALYPHMTVYKNVAFPLTNLRVEEEVKDAAGKTVLDAEGKPLIKKRKLTKIEIDKLVRETAKIVQIEEYLWRKPNQLSGGQQQRVAIARALVKHPRVLLLDEPLSNLDARLRLQTREEIRRIQKSTGITTIFVTHDQEEAMSISDEIVVMKLGIEQQSGLPQDVYNEPANRFVANFLGTPPINFFRGEIRGNKIYVGEAMVKEIVDKTLPDQKVIVGIRPEGIVPDPKGVLPFTVSQIITQGRDVLIQGDHPDETRPCKFVVDAFTEVKVGDIRCNVKPHKCFAFSLEGNEERIA